jgi:hypothetical protein
MYIYKQISVNITRDISTSYSYKDIDIQSKNVESNAYALDSARIQISLGLR